MYKQSFAVATFVITLVFSAISIKANENDGWKIIKSDESGLELSYSPQIESIRSIVTEDGVETIIPHVKGAQVIYNKPGEPINLEYQVIFCVPSKNGFKLSDYSYSSGKYSEGRIAPSPSIEKVNGFYSEIFRVSDFENYKDFLKPEVKCEYLGISAQQHFARISVRLLGTDSEYKYYFIPESFNIKIAFTEKPESYAQKSEQTSNLPINFVAAQNWRADINKPNSDIIQHKGDKTLNIESLNPTCIKIAINEEGVYRIDNSMLSSLGVNLSAEEVKTLKLYGNGGMMLSEYVPDALLNKLNEHEIIVNTQSDGKLESLIFYASPAGGFSYNGEQYKHYINLYSDKNYYILAWGGSQGKRAEAKASPTGETVNYPTSYIHRIYFEEELNCAFSGGSGRIWFGRSIYPTTFTNQLYNLVRSGNIFYRVAAAHRASQNGVCTVTESGVQVAKFTINGTSNNAYRQEASGTIPTSNIAADERSVLKFDYSPGETSATFYFDWYEIAYPRLFVPISNEISIYSDPSLSGITEFRINPFSSTQIYGYDATDLKNPKLIENLGSGTTFIFKDDLTFNSPKHYFISSTLRKPIISKSVIGNLRTEVAGKQFIIITPPAFKESAEKLKAHREQHDGISPYIVTTDEIYNEFNSGLPDPMAIRDFISYTLTNWNEKPLYVLLFGDGHYDYKNITSSKTNYILPYESDDQQSGFQELSTFTSDDYLARCIGNDKLIDISIGRITVETTEEAETVVDKIIRYDNESSDDQWQTVITLIADDSFKNTNYGDGDLHTGQSERLSKYLPLDMQQKKLYLVEYPTENVPGGRRKPGVTQDMLNIVNNAGSLFLSWIGHGNPRVLSHEEIFERESTPPLMLNSSKMFFLSAATCDFGRFDMPDLKSGAEVLLLHKTGGAISLFATSREVISNENAEITYKFYQEQFTRNPATGKYPRLGDVYFKIKQAYFDPNDEKFYLLGDPTLRLRIPELAVVIDSINNKAFSSLDTLKLQGLDNIQIKGRIVSPLDSTTISNFNGTATITMLDSDIPKIVYDTYDDSMHSFIKPGAALNRSSYSVENGYFTASFIIPKDISFSENNGRLFIFANSDDKRYAKGSTNSFTINGINTSVQNDNQGPEIKIYLDSRTFVPYDIVSKNPLLIVDLWDESGINSTGKGIGHRIEAWLDDNPKSYNLTEKFTNSLVDSHSGTIYEQLYNLTPGLHKISIRAWDVFNNYSIAETFFVIAGNNEGVIIQELYNVPNPVIENGTAITFKHNATPPYQVEVSIFNTLGNEIIKVSGESSDLHSSTIYWSGRAADGSLLPSGAYYYRLTIRSEDGKTGSKTSGMVLTH